MIFFILESYCLALVNYSSFFLILRFSSSLLLEPLKLLIFYFILFIFSSFCSIWLWIFLIYLSYYWTSFINFELSLILPSRLDKSSIDLRLLNSSILCFLQKSEKMLLFIIYFSIDYTPSDSFWTLFSSSSISFSRPFGTLTSFLASINLLIFVNSKFNSSFLASSFWI